MKEKQCSVYVTLIQTLQSKLATVLTTDWARASLRGFCKVSCTDLFINLFIKRKLMIGFTAVLLHREFAMSTGAVLRDGAHLAVPRKDGMAGLGFDKKPWAGTDDIHSSMDYSRKPASGKI